WMRKIQARNEPIPVRFALAAGGAEVYTGKVRSIEARSEVAHDGQSKVRILVDLDEASVHEFRSGETVYADVDCGRRSLAFVLFHRMVESAWRWLWL
ncbi:MAG: hypothetical protein AAGJ83_14525, partial [Planctomycetota bacterium]